MDTITLTIHHDRMRQLQAEAAAQRRMRRPRTRRRMARPARRPDPATT